MAKLITASLGFQVLAIFSGEEPERIAEAANLESRA